MAPGIGIGISPFLSRGGINYSSYWNTLFPPTEVNNVLFVGDSFTVGVGADTPATEGYANLLGEALVALQGSAGKGAYYPPYRSGITYPDNFGNWVYSGTSPANEQCALAIWSSTQRNQAGNISTITATGKNFTLCHYGKRFYTHSISVVVDGGDPQVFNNTAPSTSTDLLYTDEIVTATDTEHTIVITVPAGAAFFPGMLVAKNGNNGVSYTKIAYSGAPTLGYVPASFPESFANHISVLAPKLTVIELGYNDYTGQVALDDYESRMTTLITAALTHGKVAVLNNTDYNPGRAITIADYNARLASICTSTGALLVDVATVFGTAANALSNGWIVSAANWHPTTAGHQLIYETVLEALKTF